MKGGHGRGREEHTREQREGQKNLNLKEKENDGKESDKRMEILQGTESTKMRRADCNSDC